MESVALQCSFDQAPTDTPGKGKRMRARRLAGKKQSFVCLPTLHLSPGSRWRKQSCVTVFMGEGCNLERLLYEEGIIHSFADRGAAYLGAAL